MNDLDALRVRAAALHLHGLTAHWPEIAGAEWVPPFLAWEEQERACRSLERRMKAAHISRFKPLRAAVRNWPTGCFGTASTQVSTAPFQILHGSFGDALAAARAAGEPNPFERVSAVASEAPSPRFLHSALCAMSLPVRRPSDEHAPIIRKDGKRPVPTTLRDASVVSR